MAREARKSFSSLPHRLCGGKLFLPGALAREARQYLFPHCLTVSVVNPSLPRAWN
jgi:hypothetical protein